MLTRITKLLGREVYALNGKKIGKIAALSLNVETKRLADVFISALDAEAARRYNLEGKKGIVIPYRGVRAIEDVVIINNIRPLEAEPAEAGEPRAEETEEAEETQAEI